MNNFCGVFIFFVEEAVEKLLKFVGWIFLNFYKVWIQKIKKIYKRGKKKDFFFLELDDLETVDGTAALAEGGDDVLDGDGLVLGVLGVGGGITDDAIDEAAEDVTDFSVDGAGDALDTTAAGEAADGALRDGGGVGLEDLLDTLASTSRLSLGHFDGWSFGGFFY